MSRLVPLLVAALVAQTGCAGYSQNHREGLILLGAVAAVAGGTLAATGVSCRDAVECNGHRREVLGFSTAIVGVAIGGTAFAIQPKAKSP